MFLGITGSSELRKGEGEPYLVLSFKENPLDQYVNIPEKLKDLQYSRVICGVIRGCLNAVP